MKASTWDTEEEVELDWYATKEYQAYELERRGFIPAQIGVIMSIDIWTVYRYIRHNRSKRTRLGTIVEGKNRCFVNIYKRDYPYTCEMCKRGHTGRLYYHHWDDEQPHIGMWLCHYHHIIAEALDKEPGLAERYIAMKTAVSFECKAIDDEREARRNPNVQVVCTP